MFYPVNSTPVQLATADQMAALLTNTGASPVYLYRGSSVSPFAFDMVLPGGGASLQWPANAELWAVTDPGVAATTITLLFTAGATFTPAPTKVEVVSGSTSIASDAVVARNEPRTFNVSSAEALYFGAYVATTASFMGVLRAGSNSFDGINEINSVRSSMNATLLLEWGVTTGASFTVFSSNTITTGISKTADLSRPDKYAGKLTVSGPELRVTLMTPDAGSTALISLVGIKPSVTVTTITPNNRLYSFRPDTYDISFPDVSTSKYVLVDSNTGFLRCSDASFAMRWYFTSTNGPGQGAAGNGGTVTGSGRFTGTSQGNAYEYTRIEWTGPLNGRTVTLGP